GFTQTGSSSVFNGEIWPGQTVWFQGSSRGNHTTVTAPNGFRNGGTILLQSINAGYTSSLTVSSGVLTNDSGGVINVNAGNGGARSITSDILNRGTFNANVGVTVGKSGGAFLNEGNVNVATNVNLTIAGAYAQAAGATRLNGGTLTVSAPIDIQGGSLIGNGTVAASVVSGGQVSPGASAGRLTITGSYTQNGSGTLEIELGGLVAATEHDQLNVSGAAQIHGRLRVNLVNGFSPTNGQSFAVLNCASLSGRFDNFDLAPLANGLDWEVAYGPRSVVLKVSSMTNTTTQITGSVKDTLGNPIPNAEVFAFTDTATYAGLRGEYYDNADFTALKVTRLDAAVDFNWGSGSPDPAVAADSFSVRWTGLVEPRFSETYTFYTVTDDGVRLWVNGQLLVNDWTDHPPAERSGTITLINGVQYDILMEFYENGGGASAQLLWSSPSQPKQVIPSGQLTPTVLTNLQPSSSGAALVSSPTDANGDYRLDVFNGDWSVGVNELPTLGYNEVTNQTVTVSNANVVVNFVALPFSQEFFTVGTQSHPANAGALTGAGRYPSGATVSVTATPLTSEMPWQFVNWTEGDLLQSAERSYTFTLTRDRQLTANFILPSFKVTATNNPSAGGTVTGAGTFIYGASAALRANPNFGYRFDNWTEDGTIIGTAPTLNLVVQQDRSVVANYAEAHPLHEVTTATLPAGVATVAGAGAYTNGAIAQISAPTTVTNPPNIYTFRQFRLNGAVFGANAAFGKTFSTTDPTNLLFVAEYDSRSILPVVVNSSASINDPVPATTNFVLTFQFDRSMRSLPEPRIILTNVPAAVQPIVPAGGVWSTTVLSNDTYRTPPIAFSTGMDG
ncbi:MAG: hypothetical protein HY674_10355, partial [Chloroflexi bacterium]|nr:hypothetical protein [Chloroflexota bacterium]